MYIDIDGKQVWQDEQVKYITGQDKEGNNIEVDAVQKESGIWIIQSGVEMLVEPTAERKKLNQPGPTLEELKELKLEELDRARDTAINTQFTSEALGEVHTYTFDEKAQKLFNEQKSILDLLPQDAIINWYTDKGVKEHIVDQFKTLLLDAYRHKQSHWNRFIQLDAQVKAAQTEEELNRIVW